LTAKVVSLISEDEASPLRLIAVREHAAFIECIGQVSCNLGERYALSQRQ
jgi:hypothetical protein